MEHDLIGYLLNALDPETQRQVEDRLEADADARRKLVALRRALAPLDEDRDAPATPPNLLVDTLKQVAAQHCRQEAALRMTPLPAARPASRTRWRRMDVAIAAGIGLVGLFMVPPALLKVQHRQQLMACADNLKNFHAAFTQYGQDHGGRLPQPETRGPLALAGIYATALHEPQYWNASMAVVCPANDRGQRVPIPTRQELAEMFRNDPCKYEQWSKTLGGCYGYNFGYEDERGEFQPIRRQQGDEVPVLSDRPARAEESWCYGPSANSPNHASRGQNVLFLGGNVRYLTTRRLGDDDLFLNRKGDLAPGRDPRDAVLAPSEARPYPSQE